MTDYISHKDNTDPTVREHSVDYGIDHASILPETTYLDPEPSINNRDTFVPSTELNEAEQKIQKL